jgi:FkbM family methyltransferase
VKETESQSIQENSVLKKMKKIVEKLLEKFGQKVIKSNSTIEEAFAVQRLLIGKSLNKNNPVIIFDVGAFEGQTALEYHNLFEDSMIYCFEPFLPSFEILKKNTSGFNNIQVFNSAVSNFSGQLDFHVNTFSQTNSLLATHPLGNKTWGEGLLDTVKKTKINSVKLDDFIIENKIQKIDILKLDTQGTEYQIIEGASKAIKENKIFLIYLEIIIMPTYQEQKNFDEILMMLRINGFKLYNLYNYNYTNSGELRQVDAVFINNQVLKSRMLYNEA